MAILPLWHVPVLRKVLIVILFIWALYSNTDTVLKSYRQAWPMLLWALFCLLSWFWSANQHVTASHLHHDLFYALLAFGVFAGATRQPLSGMTLRIGILLCSTLNVLTAFFGSELKITWIDYYYSDVGYSSTIAVIGMVYAIAVLLKKQRDGLAWAILATSLIAGFLSANRMFFVLMLLVAFCLLCLILYRPFFKRREAWIILPVVLAAIVFSVCTIDGTRIFQKFMETFEFGDIRPRIWLAWFDFALKTPLLGSGYGRSVAQYALDGEFLKILVEISPYALMHSHNIFLNAFIETGLIGLVLFLGMWCHFMLCFYRQWQRGSATALQGFVVVLFFLAKNMTDIFFIDAAMVLVLGLVAFLLNADAVSERDVDT